MACSACSTSTTDDDESADAALLDDHKPARAELSGVLTALGVDKAQKRATGNGVTVAILDSGVDASEPSLRGRVAPGFDAVAGRESGADVESGQHGTAMAGLVASRPDDSGIRGVAPDASIVPVRIADQRNVSASIVASGLRWLHDHPPDVVLMPYSPEQWDQTVIDRLAQLRDRGVIIVLSAGNRGPMSPAPPLEGMLLAASIASDHELQRYSGSATQNGVVTPSGDPDPSGRRLLTAAPGGGFQEVAGTSASAALVAGVVAIVKSASPSSGDAVRSCLLETARDMGPAGVDHDF